MTHLKRGWFRPHWKRVQRIERIVEMLRLLLWQKGRGLRPEPQSDMLGEALEPALQPDFRKTLKVHASN